jgi:large subunit ribosomal protein L29
MKTSVIKEMTTSELLERLSEEEKQLARLKINHAVTPLENPMRISQYRKTIARIKTELRVRNNTDKKE